MSYINFQLEDGTVIQIETAEVNPSLENLENTNEELILGANKINQSFEKSIEPISKMANSLVKKLRSGFSDQPDEVEVSFGLKASGELGSFMIAKVETEANYSVTLKWKKDKEK